MSPGAVHTGGARRRYPARQLGSGTVLAVAIACVVLTAAVAVLWWVAAADAKHRAAAAADLAALAAADAARGLTDGEPCQVGERIAESHGAQLAACTVEGAAYDTVLVHTRVALPGVLSSVLGEDAADAWARAGPPPDAD